MFGDTCYLGSCDLEGLRALNDRLNAKVVEQVNDAQELAMLNSFAHESNEYQFKKCLQNRISDIASWRWVLEDLTKRLTEASEALRYEHNAIRVVIDRLQVEIDEHSRDASKPGALSPLSDSVEEAILQEYNFLREQKKKFEALLPSLEAQCKSIDKTKREIVTDIFNKEKALTVEEGCAKITSGTQWRGPCGRRQKKKRASPVTRWENRCMALKTAGLRALSMSIVTRQEMRGARMYLSITAQAYASRADAALRRRLNTNKVKLQDVYWQKEESMRDYQALVDELLETEKNILETMEQERVIEARLADRANRPDGELIKDEVDRKLKDELARLRSFENQMRTNYKRISNLQAHIDNSLSRIDCAAADLLHVVRLDNERISSRNGEPCASVPEPPPDHRGPANTAGGSHSKEYPSRSHSRQEESLESIKEVDEKEGDENEPSEKENTDTDEDEPYPFDH
ncbi:hypothetical protein PYW08_006410 [Mythimna loreyi]|uniref:Uncharacterized protein n=1 Tax=Mythimna loreyi TaxID=667449 RepID=A0ACC2QRM3_9NEOP|nr:hypothetical protein PYW08_006410 [Mythimna loreyi]